MTILTSQQERVLSYLADGRTEPQIAEAMKISRNTVKSHKKAIYARLRVRTKVEAVAMGVRRGYIP